MFWLLTWAQLMLLPAPLPEAVAQAAGFVKECIKVSDEEQIPHANGVCFEKILGKLIKK